MKIAVMNEAIFFQFGIAESWTVESMIGRFENNLISEHTVIGWTGPFGSFVFIFLFGFEMTLIWCSIKSVRVSQWTEYPAIPIQHERDAKQIMLKEIFENSKTMDVIEQCKQLWTMNVHINERTFRLTKQKSICYGIYFHSSLFFFLS